MTNKKKDERKTKQYEMGEISQKTIGRKKQGHKQVDAKKENADEYSKPKFLLYLEYLQY